MQISVDQCSSSKPQPAYDEVSARLYRLSEPNPATATKRQYYKSFSAANQCKIKLYDSIHQRLTGAKSRVEAIHGRLLEMLSWEHHQRYGTPLPALWTALKDNSEIAPPVPQQGNDVNCAMYTIAFGVAVTGGRLPDDTDFKYTAASAQADRIQIANRLNTGIRQNPENRKYLLAADSPSPKAPPANDENFADMFEPMQAGKQLPKWFLLMSRGLGCNGFAIRFVLVHWWQHHQLEALQIRWLNGKKQLRRA
ncbi:hypothetical protein B0H14DRAFT_2615518 [Mycena olivaceomarginata]|nr:hypothetical protein B0H14DRAFT_2615518 [Mycena olivaceomarginata]